MLITPRLTSAYGKARRDLLRERTNDSHWIGRLSSSALSTATAVSALSIAGKRSIAVKHGNETAADRKLIDAGIDWLAAQQNEDGGWGDTDFSYSNIATTMLVQAAIHLSERTGAYADSLDRAQSYVDRTGGTAALRQRFGRDKTFAVPILTNYALAGLCRWIEVSSLPFELACVPQRFYRWLGLPVVSYAIPALVAVGQARYHHLKPRSPLRRYVRNRTRESSLNVVQRMQPESGGFLEAIPLTSFVVMSLASIGESNHPVVQQGLKFLRSSVREDGSWPIDTNLATWNTTLAVNALEVDGKWDSKSCLEWLLTCQHQRQHPFTGATQGGWGWSDLSGAVPDTDDTAGALLALANYRRLPELSSEDLARIRSAAHTGLDWLVSLQNSDGGWPTFCRGWGKLPFDRSGTDLTAHALRALDAWAELYDHRAVKSLVDRGLNYLSRYQQRDGSWTPLWFGNQDDPLEQNPIYGTAKVLFAYRDLRRANAPAAAAGRVWLAAAQNADGGWGTAGGRNQDDTSNSSVEETALAIEALLSDDSVTKFQLVLQQGLNWLVTAVEQDRHRRASPIGLYFAKLWYYEQLYPLCFTLSALRTAVKRLVPEPVVKETHQNTAHYGSDFRLRSR